MSDERPKAQDEYQQARERMRKVAPELAGAFPPEVPAPQEFFGVPLEPPSEAEPGPTRGKRRERKRPRWKRGRGAVRKLGKLFYIRYSLGGRRIEERTDAKNETEARAILNERLGDVSKGVTPASASKTRLCELYDDLKADYRNKRQDWLSPALVDSLIMLPAPRPGPSARTRPG